MNPEIVRTVEATGEATTKFDAVSFQVKVVGKDVTGPLAKAHAKPTVKEVEELIAALQSEGVEIDPNSRRLIFSVVPNEYYENHQQKQDGYLAVYDISFRTPDILKASEIMDRLTEIENAQVSAPVFNIENPGALTKQALEDAWVNVKRRFREECEVLGKSSEDFEVKSWRVHYGDDGHMVGKAAMLACLASEMAGGDAPVKLEAGQARVSLQLHVDYK